MKTGERFGHREPRPQTAAIVSKKFRYREFAMTTTREHTRMGAGSRDQPYDVASIVGDVVTPCESWTLSRPKNRSTSSLEVSSRRLIFRR
jgi:hypothetical protein